MKTIIIAAKINYSGETFNTKLKVEYEHTGEINQLVKGKQVIKWKTEAKLTEEEVKKGYQIRVQHGFYFVKRLAIPITKSDGSHDFWYINNEGDSYQIIKISKYGRKIHEQLSKMQKPTN